MRKTTIIIALYKADNTSPCNCAAFTAVAVERGVPHCRGYPSGPVGVIVSFPTRIYLGRSEGRLTIKDSRHPNRRLFSCSRGTQRLCDSVLLLSGSSLSHTHTVLMRMYFWTKQEFKDVNKLSAPSTFDELTYVRSKQFFTSAAPVPV